MVTCCAVLCSAVPRNRLSILLCTSGLYLLMHHCCAVLCCAVLCRAVPCRAVPCRAVPCRAVPCRAVPCRAVLCCVVPCCAVLERQACQQPGDSCLLCREILDKSMVKEQNATIHFVDDRYKTVKAVAGEPSLSKVQVYMADWCVTAHSALKEACNVVFEWSQHGAQSTFSQLQIY